jgi:NhaP-type Na+/H+ or K+/H+ antiporter
MIPFLAYGIALLAGGNGFVSAFVAGTAFAGASRWLGEEDPLGLAESVSDLLGAAVWLVFGLAAVPFVWRAITGREVLFGVLALTALRMVPVAVALVGTHLLRPTVAFIGWFGPRGLASVIFALIALESLEQDDALRTVLGTISFTVLLSVIAHGFSAEPLARRYGAWAKRTNPPIEREPATQPRSRRGVPAPADPTP